MEHLWRKKNVPQGFNPSCSPCVSISTETFRTVVLFCDCVYVVLFSFFWVCVFCVRLRVECGVVVSCVVFVLCSDDVTVRFLSLVFFYHFNSSEFYLPNVFFLSKMIVVPVGVAQSDS